MESWCTDHPVMTFTIIVVALFTFESMVVAIVRGFARRAKGDDDE